MSEEQRAPGATPPNEDDEAPAVLRAAEPGTAKARANASRRPVLAALFWLLASLSIMLSGVTVWAHQTLLTSDGWGGIVEEVIDQPEVIENVSTVLVTRLSDRLGVQDVVADFLPGSLDIVAGAITAGVEDRVIAIVADVAASDTIQGAFVRVNKAAHDAAMAAIRGGEGAALTSEGGVLTLNLFPLVEGVLVSLQEAGLISADRDIPDLTEYQLPEQAVAALERLLGRDLPDDIGTVVLIDSERLDLVQTVVRWFDLITIVALGLAVLFTALALWLADRRIRMLMWLAVGAAAALAAGRLLARLVFAGITSRASEADAGVTVQALIEAALDSLLVFILALMLIALLVALAAWWWERARAGERPSEVTPPRTLGQWLRVNAGAVLAAGLAVVAFVVVWAIGGLELAMVAAAAIGLLLIGYRLLTSHDEPGTRDEPSGAEGG